MAQGEVCPGPQRSQSAGAANTVEEDLFDLVDDSQVLADEVIESWITAVCTCC